MSIFNSFSAEILILLFFIITYFFSVIEKVTDWKGTVSYYTNHFHKTVLKKLIPLLLINVVIFETAALFLEAELNALEWGISAIKQLEEIKFNKSSGEGRDTH